MCTSFSCKDAAGNVYFGRTLELTIDLPYQVVHYPAGFETISKVPGHPEAVFYSRLSQPQFHLLRPDGARKFVPSGGRAATEAVQQCYRRHQSTGGEIELRSLKWKGRHEGRPFD